MYGCCFERYFMAFSQTNIPITHIHTCARAQIVKAESIESKTQSTGMKYPLNSLVYGQYYFFASPSVQCYKLASIIIFFYNDFFDVADMLIRVVYIAFFLFVYCFGWCAWEMCSSYFDERNSVEKCIWSLLRSDVSMFVAMNGYYI